MPYDRKEYRKTPQRKKSITIYNWKRSGLIGDYEVIYNRYLNTTHCDLCNIELCGGNKGNNKKVMEHDHNTGEFRNVVCHKCNQNKIDRKKKKDNTTGYKNVYYDKKYNGWIYKKIFKGITDVAGVARYAYEGGEIDK